jgi:hypothetical protein
VTTPVELPWDEHGFLVREPDGNGDVPVHLGGGDMYLKPTVVRELARALWTAADAAEDVR